MKAQNVNYLPGVRQQTCDRNRPKPQLYSTVCPFWKQAHSAIWGKHSSYFHSKVLCGFTKPTRSQGRKLSQCLCKLLGFFPASTENLSHHKINEGQWSEGVKMKYFFPSEGQTLLLHSVGPHPCFPHSPG